MARNMLVSPRQEEGDLRMGLQLGIYKNLSRSAVLSRLGCGGWLSPAPLREKRACSAQSSTNWKALNTALDQRLPIHEVPVSYLQSHDVCDTTAIAYR